MADNWYINQDIICVNAGILDKCLNEGRSLLEKGRVYQISGIKPRLGDDGFIGLYIKGIEPPNYAGIKVPFSAQRFRPVLPSPTIRVFEAFLTTKDKIIELV